MENRIVAVVVAILVGVILLGSLLSTTIDTYDEEKKTYTNEGLPFALTNAEDDTTHTIISSLVDNQVILTVDGEELDISYFQGYGEFTLVFGEHSILRYTVNSGRTVFGGIATSDATSSAWSDIGTPSADAPVTITITGTTLTASGNNRNVTLEDNWAYLSPGGSYRYTINPYVTESDRIIGGGVTYSPFPNPVVICFDGTMENVSWGIYRSNPFAEPKEYVVNSTQIESNLYRIDSIVFTATQEDVDKNATYTYFLAPAEIQYDNPDYLGDDYVGLFSAIMVLFVAGVVVIGIRSFMGNRD